MNTITVTALVLKNILLKVNKKLPNDSNL